MKLRHLLLASSVALVTVVPTVSAMADEPAAPAPPSPTAARDRFAGNFNYVGGDKQLAARDAAIEKATDSMFFATRGIARGRVKDKTVIRQQLGFSFAGGNITATASNIAPAVSPENGSPAPYKSGDDTVQLSQKISPEGKLLQTFTASDGSRSNTYILSPDGKTLNVYITLQSAKLPQPVSYTLTYARAS